MRRLRQDLNHLVSAGLLFVAVSTIVTGAIADVWDLDGFGWHKYAGYVMTGFALAHVSLNWRKLVAYARFRLRRRSSSPAAPRRQAVPLHREPVTPATAGRAVTAALVSRRGLLGLGVGAMAGAFAGRGLRPAPIIAPGEDIALVYHEWSKPGVLEALGTLTGWGRRPPQFKRYEGVASLPLHRPQLRDGLATERAMMARHSTRRYAGHALTLEQLSRLLLLTAGVTHDGRRSHPSSGALYPIEVYPVVHDVEGLEPGLYHYCIRDHALEHLREGDLRGDVVRQALTQSFLADANVILYFTVIFQRMRFKYQDRAYRYGLIETGHLGQNAYLAATSMGLGACAVGAFDDDGTNRMLGVDGRSEAAVYMVALGTV
jgi:SagB-type dehydrogenase family enzyme